MIATIEQQLIEFVANASAIDIEIDRDTDLVETNVLDSLLLMELVIVIESTWSVRLNGKDITPANFRTIGRLAEQIDAKIDDSPIMEAASL